MEQYPLLVYLHEFYPYTIYTFQTLEQRGPKTETAMPNFERVTLENWILATEQLSLEPVK